jgi:translocator protein
MKYGLTTEKILVIVSSLAMILVNILANTMPLGGVTTGEVSARFPTAITPAGYTFAIWTLIYAGLIGFSIYQALPAQDNNEAVRTVRIPIVLSNLANIVWIYLWHHFEIRWSLLAISGLLAVLAYAYVQVDRIPARTEAELWLLRVPLSVYLGWVTVATVVNTAVTLVYLGWGGLGLSDPMWGTLVLAVVALLCAALALYQADMALSLTFIWALVGIARGQADLPLVPGMALIAVGMVLLSLYLSRRYPEVRLL